VSGGAPPDLVATIPREAFVDVELSPGSVVRWHVALRRVPGPIMGGEPSTRRLIAVRAMAPHRVVFADLGHEGETWSARHGDDALWCLLGHLVRTVHNNEREALS